MPPDRKRKGEPLPPGGNKRATAAVAAAAVLAHDEAAEIGDFGRASVLKNPPTTLAEYERIVTGMLAPASAEAEAATYDERACLLLDHAGALDALVDRALALRIRRRAAAVADCAGSLRSGEWLTAFKATIEPFRSAMRADRAVAGTIFDAFVVRMGGAPPEGSHVDVDVCEWCGGTMLCDEATAAAVCSDCWHSEPCLGDVVREASYGPQKFSYSLVGNCEHILMCLQAREQFEVPADIVEDVARAFHEQRVPHEKITPRLVLTILHGQIGRASCRERV